MSAPSQPAAPPAAYVVLRVAGWLAAALVVLAIAYAAWIVLGNWRAIRV